jgi:hypothetical protein
MSPWRGESEARETHTSRHNDNDRTLGHRERTTYKHTTLTFTVQRAADSIGLGDRGEEGRMLVFVDLLLNY